MTPTDTADGGPSRDRILLTSRDGAGVTHIFGPSGLMCRSINGLPTHLGPAIETVASELRHACPICRRRAAIADEAELFSHG